MGSGSAVTYIGSIRSGTMADNNNDGYDGYTIAQIQSEAGPALRQRPNVVLLHAGTNDMNDSPPTDPYATAPDRLGTLIDTVLCTCPDAVVLVAQIINSATASTESRIVTYDDAVPSVVSERSNKGFKVYTVDMRSITAADLFDTLHPTDAGYNMMATLWFDALQEVSGLGWITPPVAPDTGTGQAEECASGLFWDPANDAKPIASGGRIPEAVEYSRTTGFLKARLLADLTLTAPGVRFADINGDGELSRAAKALTRIAQRGDLLN